MGNLGGVEAGGNVHALTRAPAPPQQPATMSAGLAGVTVKPTAMDHLLPWVPGGGRLLNQGSDFAPNTDWTASPEVRLLGNSSVYQLVHDAIHTPGKVGENAHQAVLDWARAMDDSQIPKHLGAIGKFAARQVVLAIRTGELRRAEAIIDTHPELEVMAKKTKAMDAVDHYNGLSDEQRRATQVTRHFSPDELRQMRQPEGDEERWDYRHPKIGPDGNQIRINGQPQFETRKIETRHFNIQAVMQGGKVVGHDVFDGNAQYIGSWERREGLVRHSPSTYVTFGGPNPEGSNDLIKVKPYLSPYSAEIAFLEAHYGQFKAGVEMTATGLMCAAGCPPPIASAVAAAAVSIGEDLGNGKNWSTTLLHATENAAVAAGTTFIGGKLAQGALKYLGKGVLAGTMLKELQGKIYAEAVAKLGGKVGAAEAAKALEEWSKAAAAKTLIAKVAESAAQSSGQFAVSTATNIKDNGLDFNNPAFVEQLKSDLIALGLGTALGVGLHAAFSRGGQAQLSAAQQRLDGALASAERSGAARPVAVSVATPQPQQSPRPPASPPTPAAPRPAPAAAPPAPAPRPAPAATPAGEFQPFDLPKPKAVLEFPPAGQAATGWRKLLQNRLDDFRAKAGQSGPGWLAEAGRRIKGLEGWVQEMNAYAGRYAQQGDAAAVAQFREAASEGERVLKEMKGLAGPATPASLSPAETPTIAQGANRPRAAQPPAASPSSAETPTARQGGAASGAAQAPPATPAQSRIRLTGANGNMTPSDASYRLQMYESAFGRAEAKAVKAAGNNWRSAVGKSVEAGEAREAELQLQLAKAISEHAKLETFVQLMREESDFYASVGGRGASPRDIRDDALRLYNMAHGAYEPTTPAPSSGEMPIAPQGPRAPRAAQTAPAAPAAAQGRARLSLTNPNGGITPSVVTGRLQMFENAFGKAQARAIEAVGNNWRSAIGKSVDAGMAREAELNLQLARAVSGPADQETFVRLMREEAEFYATFGDPMPSAAEIEKDAQRLFGIAHGTPADAAAAPAAGPAPSGEARPSAAQPQTPSVVPASPSSADTPTVRRGAPAVGPRSGEIENIARRVEGLKASAKHARETATRLAEQAQKFPALKKKAEQAAASATSFEKSAREAEVNLEKLKQQAVQSPSAAAGTPAA